ncbi:MAG: mannose-6-phosphate isomerase-like protein (cupin superfamily) [Planctomycetota bacterium]|jgi:mannose-6-phosphate isomerase-like protein (cupin superfamily)
MTTENSASIRSAEIVLPCDDLDETLSFYVDDLKFSVDTIIPADAPRIAVISGHGLTLRLEIGSTVHPPALRLACENPDSLFAGAQKIVAPNGVAIEIVGSEEALIIPQQLQQVVVTKSASDATWVTGRVGMRYRDLIPSELGGRYGASHIHVIDAGPLKDYVHYHVVRFQMIYCYKGWARLVYEDQGPSFVFNAGDCVLQPPEIRHRVLESSGDLHVIELSCPAGHTTHSDKTMDLPNKTVNTEREFTGQVFTHHAASAGSWGLSQLEGFEARDLLIEKGTKGLAKSVVLRPHSGAVHFEASHDCDFFFMFILEGALTLQVKGREEENLKVGDSFVIPPHLLFTLSAIDPKTELLHVSLPKA